MGSREAYSTAQAIIEKYAEKDNEQQVVEQTQTVPVVESANPQPVATPVIEETPVVVVPDPQPVVVESQPSTVEQELREELAKSQNAYKSLKGKYNKELPESRNDTAQLRDELMLIKSQLAQQASKQFETPAVNNSLKDYLGQEKVDELGEDYVKAIEEGTDWKIKQALAQQQASFDEDTKSIKETMYKEKWDRYNQSVGAQVNNFIDLIDPLGDGQLDSEFSQYLQEKYMYSAFDNADKDMNTRAVVDICNMYNDYKNPPVVAQPAVQAPVQQPNPKAQLSAPNSTNNSSPQLQPQTPSYMYTQSDYLREASKFSHNDTSIDGWLRFETKYKQALSEGKVNLNA